MSEIEDMALRLASPAELREMVQTLTRERDEAVADRRLAWDRLDRIRAALDDAGAPDGDGLDQRIGTLAAQRDEAVGQRDAARMEIALARLGEEEAAEQSHEAIVRTCRVCGCTDEWGCDGGCSWAKDDLCSECSPAEASDAALARLGEGE